MSLRATRTCCCYPQWSSNGFHLSGDPTVPLGRKWVSAGKRICTGSLSGRPDFIRTNLRPFYEYSRLEKNSSTAGSFAELNNLTGLPSSGENPLTFKNISQKPTETLIRGRYFNALSRTLMGIWCDWLQSTLRVDYMSLFPCPAITLCRGLASAHLEVLTVIMQPSLS